ncbi:MAG: phospho-N-acetylmuramoyl-pentapeptide-transferase [Bacteroidales bacterium]|jgi:phospho-N-acetylmuramoyl-pentapeptide-transferase|nr:phospho-N-acetylmuramoyl-pentapeptide-transferase [Bacteroidales bacterium]
MLYYLFDWLDKSYDFPGAGVFQYLSFRGGMAVVTSLLITAVFGKYLIRFLKKHQVGETVRDLGLKGQMEKQGTPTMGGLIIISGILIPVLLFCKLDNIYIILLIFTTLWLGLIGFIDDYIKIFKKNKKGLSGKYKIVGQVILGIVVGCTIYFSDDVVIRETIEKDEIVAVNTTITQDAKSLKTTIPFVKNNEFDYGRLVSWACEDCHKWAFLIFIPIVIFIITAVSNGANLTDGIDGLAAGTSSVIGGSLAILTWVSGNIIFANYLDIMYIPNVGEVTIFMGAFVGACGGFLWYNTHPAQVFMGDTGSLTIGGIIAVVAIIIRKELLLPLLCGIFLVEALSVIIQTRYFKYTKKKYGEGKRIFLMSPLHHHYQKTGIAEEKIVQRFIIVSIGLAILSIVTLKLR